jgi:hypothetical protein
MNWHIPIELVEDLRKRMGMGSTVKMEEPEERRCSVIREAEMAFQGTNKRGKTRGFPRR